MKPNMGNADRIVRIVAVMTIVSFYLLNLITGTLAYILLTVAGIFLFTSFAGVCPLYSLLKLKKRNIKR